MLAIAASLMAFTLTTPAAAENADKIYKLLATIPHAGGAGIAIDEQRTNELIDTISFPNDKLFGVAVDSTRRNVYTTGVLTGNLYVISAGPAKKTKYDPYTLE